MGADRQRSAAQSALGRRPAVLRDPLLPRAGHGNRLHRRQALGDPAPRRRQRLPRGAHDPEPRREAGEPRRSRRGGLRLRRPVRGQGRAREEGNVLGARRVRCSAARLQAREVHARDVDLGVGAGPGRQGRAHVQGSHRAAQSWTTGPRRCHGIRRRRNLRAAEVRAWSAARAPEHGAQPREMDRGGASARVRLGRAPRHVPAQPRRPCGPALLAARRRGAKSAGSRPALVHDDVRPRQHLHEPAGAAVHARARGDDAARARGLAGQPRRRLPRRGSRPDPARDALRRDDCVRGASALAVLRLRRRDAAVRRAARRVRALDGRPQARAGARERGPSRAQLDRRVRGSPRHRLHLVPAAQREDGAREPVLEGLLGLDLLPRRPVAGVPTRDLRAAGVRVRREGARRSARPSRLEGPGSRRSARA